MKLMKDDMDTREAAEKTGISSKWKMGISSPWVSYVHRLEALFGPDPDITIEYNHDNDVVSMYVNGQEKADALSKLIPEEKVFGGVRLKIRIVPANLTQKKADLIRAAFEGNPLFSETIQVHMEGSSNAFTYVMFKRGVVQYWDDNLGDPHGRVSTLAQNLASEVLITEGVCFCTE